MNFVRDLIEVMRPYDVEHWEKTGEFKLKKDIVDVSLNGNWFDLKDIDIKKAGKYLCRPKNPTYKNCISILVIYSHTWMNH